MKRKLKLILCLLLAFSFVTVQEAGNISCAAVYDDEYHEEDDEQDAEEEDIWHSAFPPYWPWGKRIWKTAWGPVRELASDNFGKLPEEKTVFTVPEGTEVLRATDLPHTNNIVEIKLPESLRKIEDGALCCIWYLQKITIPSGVTEVPDTLFDECENLRTIENLSSLTLRLSDRDEIIDYRGLPGLEYYVDGEKVTEVPPGKTAIGVGRTFSLTYNLNGGKMVGKKVKTYQYGDVKTKLPKAKRRGYIFLGWGFPGDKVTYRTWHSLYNENGYITGPMTLNARWKKIKVKKSGKKKIQIQVYKRFYWEKWEVACLYSTKKNMKGAKVLYLGEEFDTKKKGKIRGKQTKEYASNYYPKKKLYTCDLKKLKKGKTYYLQFRRIHHFNTNKEEVPSTYFYLYKKALKTVKVKL